MSNREPFIGDLAVAQHIRERNAALALVERANAAIAKASERDLPAYEQRQVRRFSAVQHPTAASIPGVKGGQARSGAEIERNATVLGLVLITAAGAVIGCLIGHGLATAADAFGRHVLSRLF